MSTHSEAARHFVADAERMAWHDRALYAVREKRDRMMESIPEWEALRSAASQIKLHTLSRLGHYLEEFERNATANGMVVHWAADGAAMNEIVWQLIREHGGHRLIKPLALQLVIPAIDLVSSGEVREHTVARKSAMEIDAPPEVDNLRVMHANTIHTGLDGEMILADLTRLDSALAICQRKLRRVHRRHDLVLEQQRNGLDGRLAQQQYRR